MTVSAACLTPSDINRHDDVFAPLNLQRNLAQCVDDFGAHLVQTLVEKFEQVYPEEGKDGINLIVFLSELYNFGVVAAGLIYDLIRVFLERLSEYDTELLLKLIQSIS